MHVQRNEPKKGLHDCCPQAAAERAERAKDPPKGECKCEIKSAPDAVGNEIRLAAPQAPILEVSIPEPPTVAGLANLARTPPILFYSDRSPPTVFRHPDRGRAPPAT